MSIAAELLARSRRALRDGTPNHALDLATAALAAGDAEERFDATLVRAAILATGLDRPDEALVEYERARELAREHRLPRAGEADLGLGTVLLDLGDAPRARQALRRAALAFRQRGRAHLRGCAEMLLSGEALDAGESVMAERHAELAADLLAPAAEPRLLSELLTLRAEIRFAEDRPEEARHLLSLAAGTALRLTDDALIERLRARRRAVRARLAGHP